MLTLTKKELKSNQESKVCCIRGKRFIFLCEWQNLPKSCNYRDHCNYAGKYRGAHSIRNLKFNVPNEIPIILNKGLNYDYYVIIKELAREFEG